MYPRIRRDREVSFPALILAPLLGSLITLTAAWCTTGSRARRVAGVVIGACALLAPWLLPPRPPIVRAIYALVCFVNVMRVVDLAQVRAPWSLPRRVLHVISVVDSRRLMPRTPRLEGLALLAFVSWEALFAACIVVITRAPAAGITHWLVRWSAGVVAIYAAVSGLYRLSFVVYGALGFDVPPLHVAPVRSRSVQELWGERWARPISDWLGATFFRPWARRRRPLVGVVLAFVVSAAFHAYAIWVGLGFSTGLAMTALTFAYFVAQAIVMSIEQLIGVRRWPVPAGHAWTIAWMLALSPMFVEPALHLVYEPMSVPPATTCMSIARSSSALVVVRASSESTLSSPNSLKP